MMRTSGRTAGLVLLIRELCFALVSMAVAGCSEDASPTASLGLPFEQMQLDSVEVPQALREYLPAMSGCEVLDGRLWEHVLQIDLAGPELLGSVPAVLSVADDNTHIHVVKGPSMYSRAHMQLESGVRLLLPPGGAVRLANGTEIVVNPPWPETLRLASGELPEYATVTPNGLIPFEHETVWDEDRRAYTQPVVRCRTDILFVLDDHALRKPLAEAIDRYRNGDPGDARQ